MNVETARAFLLSLPYVEETMQWGDNLVFRVGDKSIGGKMFAIMNLSPDKTTIGFAAGPERFAELVENDGIIPAPYFARIYWVALERWDALPAPELREHLTHARNLVFEKLPKKTKELLASPAVKKNKPGKKSISPSLKKAVRKK